MPHSDPLSDMITRIRNASVAKHKNVSIPASKVKAKVLEVIHKEGYISGFRTMKDKGRSFLDVELRYKPNGDPYITNIKRMSKPGLRFYSSYRKIPRVRSGFGVMILSTPKGILTDRLARKEKVGGELICSIF